MSFLKTNLEKCLPTQFFQIPTKERKLPTKESRFNNQRLPSRERLYRSPLPFGTFESMIFIFLRWDMLVPFRLAHHFLLKPSKIKFHPFKKKHDEKNESPLETPVGSPKLVKLTVSFSRLRIESIWIRSLTFDQIC